ncbi:hypothetical protein BDR07DRAFT_1100786 [Suillus spraguei]|nr:hypothetical protein BDR07DRAFT_1100786 [Suillus spraguei]
MVRVNRQPNRLKTDNILVKIQYIPLREFKVREHVHIYSTQKPRRVYAYVIPSITMNAVDCSTVTVRNLC